MTSGAWGWLVLFFGFVGYAVRVAPPADPALTRALIHGTLTGDFGSIDPSIAAVFSALGVVPLLAATFTLRDGARRKVPAWPFALAMFAVGAFALLPWLAVRGAFGPRAEPRPPSLARRFLAHPIVAWGIVVCLVGLTVWGIAAGSPEAYVRAFRTTAMVHVMTIDFVVCTLLLTMLMEEERARSTRESQIARVVRVVPLFGTALWNALTRRPA